MSRILLALVLAFAWTGVWAVPTAPTNLLVACGQAGSPTATPTDCVTGINPNATFSWTTPSNDVTFYQIQTGLNSTFNGSSGICSGATPSTPCPYFWDNCGETQTSTGAGSREGANNSPSPADYSCTDINRNDRNTFKQPSWRGGRLVYWRVRVTDAVSLNTADGTWSTWSSSTLAYELPPSPPGSVAVANGSGGGAIENYGDITAGTTRHFSVGGSGSACSLGSPCLITTAVSQAVGGDILMGATGTYAFPTLTSPASRSKAKPIKITSESGQTVTFNSTVNLSQTRWIVDGVTVTVSSGRQVTYSAANVIIKNSIINGTGQAGASDQTSSVLLSSNEGNHFLKNVLVCPLATDNIGIFLGSGVDAVMRGNSLTGQCSRGLKQNGGQNIIGNISIIENRIANTGANGSAISGYYGFGEAWIARNLINPSSSPAVQFVRPAWGSFLNNVIGSTTGGISDWHNNESDGQTYIDGDMWYTSEFPFTLDTDGDEWLHNHKIQFRNSNAWKNSGSQVTRWHESWPSYDGCDIGANEFAQNCVDYTPSPPSAQSANPNLPTNLKPTSCTSPLCNLGPVAAPVPVGGGARVDIGRYEYGATIVPGSFVNGDEATGTYDYQSRWTANTTPRISWTFVDPNNAWLGGSQTQGYYEVQLDTVNTFDSRGEWKPYCSSGKVSSASGFWDVPAGTYPTGCELQPSTKYYVRVRTYDSVDSSRPGLWSDYANAFTTAASDCTAYVDTVACSGDYSIANRSCTGTDGTSYATWQTAIAAATAGNTICGRAGTYTETSFALQHTGGQGVNGTAGNPITYTNYNNETVIIDGSSSNNAHGGGTGKGTTIDNHANYVVFRGLKVRNGGFEGFDNRGDNVTVDQCDIYNNGTWESQNNVQNEDGADNFTLTRSKLYWDGSFVSNATRTAGGGCSTGEDRDCTSHNLYLQGNNATVKNNWIYDTLGNGAAVGAAAAYGVQIGTTGLSYSGVTFAYNTIAYVATRAGILLYDDETNANIYNNIVKDASADGNSSGSISLQNTASTGNFVVNNLLQTVGATQGVTGTLATISGNIVGSDPLFVDYANRDLHVNGTSPAIDAASATITVSDDFDGDARPIGSTYDIGADEAAADAGTCGDNNTDGTDVCDGTDLNGEDCVSQGFASGTLACATDCTAYDTSGCVPVSSSGSIRGAVIKGGTVK